MAGNNSIRGDETITFTDNMSFDGTERGGKLTTNGQLWIGCTTAPHVRKGNLTSVGGSVAISTGTPGTIDLSIGNVPASSVIGNTTGVAPAAGIIGEQIRSTVAAPGTAFSNNTPANLQSISLTAGIWDVSSVSQAAFTGTATLLQTSISTTSATQGTAGDNRVDAGVPTGAPLAIVPSYRLTLSATTTVYHVITVLFSTGSCNCYGRISATRVG